MKGKANIPADKMLAEFLSGKSDHTIDLFHHFIEAYRRIGNISIHSAKTMIGIATSRKRIAYVTQLGKNFIHVVFPFDKAHSENLCFQKIAQVPGDEKQFNHHLRICEGRCEQRSSGFYEISIHVGELSYITLHLINYSK